MAQASQLLPTPDGPTRARLSWASIPFSLRELQEQGAIEPTGSAIVDILDARLLAQFGGAQSRRQAFVPPP
jgi:hypothetical protein